MGFLRIGSLNVRVKKTTEAFSNFLGVGNSSQPNRIPVNVRTSAPPNSSYFEKINKNWGSADNIQHNDLTNMPPPKYGSSKKHRSKRAADGDVTVNRTHSHSMPTTPNQPRAPMGSISNYSRSHNIGDSDSDSAYGFDSNWNGVNNEGSQKPTYI